MKKKISASFLGVTMILTMFSVMLVNAQDFPVPVTATAVIPSPSFIVTIPETIDFASQTQALDKYRTAQNDQLGNPVIISKTFKIAAPKVENLFADAGKKPQLDIKATFDGNLTGTSPSNKIPYTVKIKNGSDIISETTIIKSFKNTVDLQVGETNEQELEIFINRCDIKQADGYTGTMTFTLAIPNSGI